jgi:hypothetical protein
VALVHIDNLAPGMVLARNVCDRSGRLLLPAGAELSEKHFGIFRMWGILEAEIVGESPATEDHETPVNLELDPVALAKAREEVEILFVHNDFEHPAIKELMRLCVDRRAARAS